MSKFINATIMDCGSCKQLLSRNPVCVFDPVKKRGVTLFKCKIKKLFVPIDKECCLSWQQDKIQKDVQEKAW